MCLRNPEDDTHVRNRELISDLPMLRSATEHLHAPDERRHVETRRAFWRRGFAHSPPHGAAFRRLAVLLMRKNADRAHGIHNPLTFSTDK